MTSIVYTALLDIVKNSIMHQSKPDFVRLVLGCAFL